VTALIVGCGELGSRHAQALAKHGEIRKIVLVDPSPDSLTRAIERVREVGFDGEICSYNEIPNDLGHLRIAIISTSSNQRVAALKNFLEKSSANYVVLEKLLAPTLEQLQELKETVQLETDVFWVNCPMSFYPHYEEISIEIGNSIQSVPLKYSVTASNLGLVTNLIHYLDHFTSITSRPVTEVLFDPESTIVASKRPGYSELLGVVTARTDFGDEMIVSFSESHTGDHLKVDLECGDSRWLVDEIALESIYSKSGRTISKKDIYTPRQSELTHVALSQLESAKTPMWTSVKHSIDLHEKILKSLSALLGDRADIVFT
jgi:predicted dehydrogenase